MFEDATGPGIGCHADGEKSRRASDPCLHARLLRIGSHPAAMLINDDLSVLFGEAAALLLRQHVEDSLRGTTQARPQRRHDDGAIDQDGVSHHGINEPFVSQ